MEEKHITLPKLGESITSATVVQWFKKEGDPVKEDEALLEVTTDKINSEIPSPVSGVLKKILAQPDQELEVGEPLALISTDQAVEAAERPVEKEFACSKSGSEDVLSPAVLRLAREKKIPMDELLSIKGTGAGGRITKKDVENYAGKAPSAPKVAAGSDVEHMKMSGMRKMIADNLKRSFYEAPHATLVAEADITNCMEIIASEKETFLKKNGFKLTITSFIARAIAQAVKEYPLINASLDTDTIIIKRYVNLGIAVSVEGGIIVPVIKSCHTKSLKEIAKSVAEFSKKAREETLSPDDAQEGTITMTNFGMGGALIGIPIIRYPEVAIVGVGSIQKKVVALDDNSFGVRRVINLSLTFDHRVIDGMYGCGFLGALKKHLENPSS